MTELSPSRMTACEPTCRAHRDASNDDGRVAAFTISPSRRRADYLSRRHGAYGFISAVEFTLMILSSADYQFGFSLRDWPESVITMFGA